MCFFSRPTFKTATPTNRTQLKQQLQREQLQELERRDAEKRVAQQQLLHNQKHFQQTPTPSSSTTPLVFQQHQPQGSVIGQSTPLKVPLQSIGVDVPPQVLQVRRLENNRYDRYFNYLFAGENCSRKSNTVSCYPKTKKSSATVLK